jgi:hypothetical protein
MAIETIGEALTLGWRVHVRCDFGKRDGMKSIRPCVYGEELHLSTLVWTRGRAFPLDMLASRLRCPLCGSRRVRIAFTPPAAPQAVRAAR